MRRLLQLFFFEAQPLPVVQSSGMIRFSYLIVAKSCKKDDLAVEFCWSLVSSVDIAIDFLGKI